MNLKRSLTKRLHLGALGALAVVGTLAVSSSTPVAALSPETTLTTSATAPTIQDQTRPAVAFDGTNSLVVWGDSPRSGNADIYGARVDADGNTVSPGAFPISTIGGNQTAPSVTYAHGQYFVVWQDHRGHDSDVYGTAVSTAGVVATRTGVLIAGGSGDQKTPTVGPNGDNVLVAWRDTLATRGARVSPSGVVLDTGGITISPTEGSAPSTAWDGTNSLVVWGIQLSSSHGREVFGRRVSPSGLVLDSTDIVVAELPGVVIPSPDVEWTGSTFFVAFDYNGDEDVDQGYIGATTVDSNGTVSDQPYITLADFTPFWNSPPSVAFDGVTLVTWRQDSDSGSEIKGARVKADRSVVGGGSFDVGASSTLTGPGVAKAAGGSWRVAYQQGANGQQVVTRTIAAAK